MGSAGRRVSEPSRRAVLAGGGLLLAAACTGGSDGPTRPPRPTRDQRLASRVAAEVRVMSALYAATVATHPREAARLSRLAAEHDAHARALDLLGPPPASPAPSGSATPSPSTTASASVVPTDRVAALTALASAEQAAADRRRSQCVGAGRELARLLASIAACESVHARLVRPR